MDKCVGVAVALAISSHIVAGRSYLPADRNEDFYQKFEHYRPRQWQRGQRGWDQGPDASHQRPDYYQRDQGSNPHKHTHDDKDSWKTHHPSDWDSGSWEYPDFPSHGHHYQWGQHGWGEHEKPHHWPQQPHGSWNNRPTSYEEKPSTWAPVPSTSNPPRRTTTVSGSQTTLAIVLCIKSCPVTSEYNPVCGSDNLTYGNPGRLECAKYCGVDVTFQSNSACPPPGFNTAAPDQTTANPGQPTWSTLKPVEPPTRFTTIEIPGTLATNKPTISSDILDSIFTSTPATTDDNYDIDIRTRSRGSKVQPFQIVFPD